MKKLILSMLVAAAALTSCEKSVLAVDDSGATGDVVTLTVNAETVAGTRALDPSNADAPANYYLEVWLDGVQYLENQYSADGKFELQLINKQEYTLVAWADYDTEGADGYYDPTDLTNVTVSTDAEVLAINTLNRDAFAGTLPVTLKENDAVSMTLTRPFARVNVTTTDYAQITESFRPEDVKLTYKTVYTGYNVMAGTEGEGEVTGDTDGFVSDVTAFVDASVDESGNLQLSADYLFVPNDGAIIEFTAEYTLDGTYVTDYTFSNIPIKKNFQTNISGAILTNSGSLTITVDQDWDGEENVDVLVASSPEVATDLLDEAANGSADEISITVLGTEGGEIQLPDTEANITITFLEEQTGDVTIGNDDDDFDGHAYVAVTTSGDLDVDLPEGSFTMLTGSSAAGGTIETEDNTFTVSEGASIGNIEVLGGNVTVYGTVGDITSTAAITVTVYDDGTIGTINGEDIELVEIITGAILNLNNGVSYANVQAAIDAAEAGDVIELVAGEYSVTMPEGFNQNSSNRVISIDKDLTIQSEGATIISDYITTTGNPSGQSTYFIEGGANVTFDGLTIMSHIATYSSYVPYYANKVVEVLDGATFNMINCVTIPNTYVDGYTALSAGGVYVNDDGTLNISNSILYNSSISAGNLDNDVVTIKNTVFDNSFISTPSWDATFMPQNSTMEMYVENCTFQNWSGAYTGTLSDNQIIRAYYGTITLNGCTFPSDAQYWSCPITTSYAGADEAVWTGGIIWVDGVLYTPEYFNYTTMTAYADYTTLMAGVASGDEVYVGAGTYAMGTLGKNVTIYGANKGIAGYSEDRGDETRFISGSVFKAPTAPAITIAFDGVEFGDEFKGFQLQYGGNFTMKNCYVSTANASMNNGTYYLFYMHNAYKGSNPGNCVFENNLFAPTDNARQGIWIWGDKASGYENYVDAVFTDNVFTQTAFNIGTASTTSERTSTFELTGNTFNGMEVDGTKSSYAVLINHDENAFNITGNIFNTFGIGVYYSLTISDEYNAAIQADNQFVNVDYLTSKY